MGGRGARILIPYIHSYADRHGKERYYYRRGDRRMALPPPDAPDFMDKYKAAAEALAKEPAPKLRGEAGTFSRLIAEYEQSTDFKRLKFSTAAVYRNMFDKFSAKHGHRRVDQMKRQHVDLLIASMADRPGAANSFLKRLKKLMVFAISRGWITSDPTYRMKGFKAGEIHTWTEAQISQFESHWPVGTKQRLAFALHLYTGQRRSDVHRMTWADYDGEGILVTQQKTGTKLDLPVHPELKSILDASPKSRDTIVLTEFGRPFTVAGYGAWINAAIRAADVPVECVAHGLRKAAAPRMAEAGARRTRWRRLRVTKRSARSKDIRARSIRDGYRASQLRNNRGT